MRRLGAMFLALALAQAPALASTVRVECHDGTWVKTSEACRHRGGVWKVERIYPKRASRRPPPRARCRDGSVQFASETTCRYRGGIDYWM